MDHGYPRPSKEKRPEPRFDKFQEWSLAFLVIGAVMPVYVWWRDDYYEWSSYHSALLGPDQKLPYVICFVTSATVLAAWGFKKNGIQNTTALFFALSILLASVLVAHWTWTLTLRTV